MVEAKLPPEILDKVYRPGRDGGLKGNGHVITHTVELASVDGFGTGDEVEINDE